MERINVAIWQFSHLNCHGHIYSFNPGTYPQAIAKRAGRSTELVSTVIMFRRDAVKKSSLPVFKKRSVYLSCKLREVAF
jgi:hypothetical protein